MSTASKFENGEPLDGSAVSEETESESPEFETQVSSDAMAQLIELPYRDARRQAIAAFERLYIRSLLERCGGNVTNCARTAGVDRVYLHRLLRKHDVRGSKRPSLLAESEHAPIAEE